MLADMDDLQATQELALEASAARVVLVQMNAAVSEMTFSGCERREEVMLMLLAAAADDAMAMTHLLETSPIQFAAPACVLSRSLLEKFLRAAYFGRLATACELERFEQAGKLPRRIDPVSQKTRDITTAELTSEVAAELRFDALNAMVAVGWRPLCGMVHGGLELCARYFSDAGVVGSRFEPVPLLSMVHNSVVLGRITVQLAHELACSSPTVSDRELVAAAHAFEDYDKASRSRMDRLKAP